MAKWAGRVRCARVIRQDDVQAGVAEKKNKRRTENSSFLGLSHSDAHSSLECDVRLGVLTVASPKRHCPAKLGSRLLALMETA